MAPMKLSCFAFILLVGLALGGTASADEGAQKFIQTEHVKLEAILRQPATAARDAQITNTLDTMVDYDELARRSFGQPCPHAVSSCTNHWGELTDQQKAEVASL